MRADPHRMVEWLGVKSAATEQEILRIVEGRLATSVIKRLVGLGLERAEIDAAVIPSRTLQHRRSRRDARIQIPRVRFTRTSNGPDEP